jgi:hypothetical protein
MRGPHAALRVTVDGRSTGLRTAQETAASALGVHTCELVIWAGEDGDWSGSVVLQSLGSLLSQTPGSITACGSPAARESALADSFLGVGGSHPPTQKPEGSEGPFGLAVRAGRMATEVAHAPSVAWEFAGRAAANSGLVAEVLTPQHESPKGHIGPSGLLLPLVDESRTPGFTAYGPRTEEPEGSGHPRRLQAPEVSATLGDS